MINMIFFFFKVILRLQNDSYHYLLSESYDPYCFWTICQYCLNAKTKNLDRKKKGLHQPDSLVLK